jgi:rod shape-determining protein MreD
MKWTAFAILAVVTLVLQTTVIPAMAIHSIRPDWMLILAVHYALWGPLQNAAIAAWILGLLVGLESTAPDRIALYALGYGAAAWGILRVRQALFRDHPLTQVVVTFLACLLVQLLAGLYRWWAIGSGYNQSVLWPAVFTSLYTAAWAPYLHWALLRLNRWTGLRQSHNVAGYRG